MKKLISKYGFCKTLPPKDIFDILHSAEEKGIVLPKVVDDWWSNETELNEKNAMKALGNLSKIECNQIISDLNIYGRKKS